MSFKKKIFLWVGVIVLLGIGYNAYHWFDGLTQNRIGYLYSKGIILNKNDIESFKWFERSAAKGNLKGISNLGSRYYYGLGVNRNLDKAIELVEN